MELWYIRHRRSVCEKDRAVGAEGPGGHAPPPKILKDKLTLSKPGGGANYAHQITNRPPPPPSNFQTFLRP